MTFTRPPAASANADVAGNVLSYQGSTIRLRGAMLNLTDMWKAAGCPENRRPNNWLVPHESPHF